MEINYSSLVLCSENMNVISASHADNVMLKILSVKGFPWC